MLKARYVMAGVAVICLAACGGARSTGVPIEGGLVRETSGTPPVAVDRPARSADAARPAPEPASASSTAALNMRLMEQAARQSEDTDLPVGAGDLLEISVFEVEELSKIR